MFRRLVGDGEVEVLYRRMNPKTIIDSLGDYVMGEPERVAETGVGLKSHISLVEIGFPSLSLSHPFFMRF